MTDKSPGLDMIHPQVLFEIRDVIICMYPLFLTYTVMGDGHEAYKRYVDSGTELHWETMGPEHAVTSCCVKKHLRESTSPTVTLTCGPIIHNDPL